MWRRLQPEGLAKPEDALCYTLPKKADAETRASYLIALRPEQGFDEWKFFPEQNRQFALRYLYELLLAATKDNCPAGSYEIKDGFQRAIAYTLKHTPVGQQVVWLETYYHAATKEYGFLIDFHFNKSDDVPFSRDVQRLSLGLDEHYRSNKNAYIDREAIVNKFLRDHIAQMFPLQDTNLDGPVDLMRKLTFVRTEQLRPKLFMLGGGRTDESQWKGLERFGPLEPVDAQIGCIMLYRRDHRALAEDLYRGLMGKASGVAFKGIPEVFHMNIQRFFSVTPNAWNSQDLQTAVRGIEDIRRKNADVTLIVLMIEDLENSEIYYEAKYALLQRDIPLQVVSAELIQRREQFKWSVSNIALQIFTKLGGEPWKVVPAHERCLIVGIGQAHRDSTGGIQKYFAYCVATDSSGLYKKIAVLSDTHSRDTYLEEMKKSLVRELSAAGAGEYTHCVIHIPFKLKKDEMRVLEDAVASASHTESHIKFTVIKINDQHRFFGYAENNSRIPIEGTVARLSRNSMLLWFEGLKTPNDVVRKRVGGPVHLEFLWPKENQDPSEQSKHLQDLFNLSGTNWRGFNARSTPISTYYCKLIAKFLTKFPDQAPRIEATTRPWFL